jgi:hypothetical protein
VREFAARRFTDRGELARAAIALADWYLGQLGPTMRHLSGWTGLVGTEIDNLRGLVSYLTEIDQERAQQICFTIGRYLDAIGSYREGISELSGYISALRLPSPTRVSLLTTLADVHLRAGELADAERVVAEADRLRAEVGSLPDWDDVAIERTRGDLACRQGDPGSAVDSARRELAGGISPRGRARMWNQLGIAATALGDLDTAWSAFEEEAQAYRRLGDEVGEVGAEGNLAEIALRRGDIPGAAGHNRMSYQLALELGTPIAAAYSLIVAARIASLRGEWVAAVQLHAQADQMLERTGISLYEPDRRASAEMLDSARRQLGSQGYQWAEQAGKAMDLSAASGMMDDVMADIAATKSGYFDKGSS